MIDRVALFEVISRFQPFQSFVVRQIGYTFGKQLDCEFESRHITDLTAHQDNQ